MIDGLSDMFKVLYFIYRQITQLQTDFIECDLNERVK